MTTRTLCAAAAGVGMSLALMRGVAAAPAIPTRLVWHGTVCGTAEDFAARVAKRTTMVRFVRTGQQLAVRLRIERHGSGLDARVSIEARGKAPMLRHIESPDCEDALDALALVVAIGVEARAADARVAPRARRRTPVTPVRPGPTLPTLQTSSPPSSANPERAPDPTPAPAAPIDADPPVAPSEPPPEAAAETRPLVAPPSPPPPPVAATDPAIVPAASSPAPRIDAPGPPNETAANAHAIDIGAGLAAQMSFGIAPDPLIGGGVWLSAGWEGRGVWSPELVIRAVHERLHGFRLESGAVDFSLNAMGIELCPLRWGSESWFVRPCAAGAIGRLAAQGYDTFDPRSTALLWSALGASVDWIARAGIIEFRAQLGASAPLSRDRYGFGTACPGSACEADVFHRVAPLIWSGALGAGVRVW